MDYASSYAVGGPQLGIQPGMQPYAAVDADVILPAPRPQKLHWSTLVFIAGMAICAVGLLATLAGVPASMGYDVDGAPNRNKPSSNDPLKMSQSLDGNMKWIAQNSSDADGAYVGYIKSINRSEAAIPVMVQALVAMDASVRSIDSGLGDLGATTKAMRENMDEMASVSAASAGTMTSLGADIGFLSSSMLQLAGSTRELTERMAAIEKKAAGIATNGTASALKNTKDLNASLPDSVPAPMTTDGQPLDVAMAALARGGGTDGAPSPGAAIGTSDTTPAPGAQPYNPYATGAAL